MKKIILTIFSLYFLIFTLLLSKPALAIVTPQDFCKSDADCKAEQYCTDRGTVTGKYCANKLQTGGDCTRNEQCASNSCQDTTSGKKCINPATGEGAIKFQPVAPALEINIPTLKPFTTSGIQQPDASGFIYIPFLGQYIVGIFRWMLLVAGIVAVVLMMAGGFIYMTAGGNKQRVDEGKDRILHALWGLLLLLGSYTILYIINPGLVEFRSLKIKVIERVDLTATEWTGENAANVTLPSGNKYCGCLNFRDLYTTSKFKDGSTISAKIREIKNNSPLVDFGNVIANDAAKYNLDPMLAVIIWKVDSGLGTAGAGARNKNPGNIICGGGGKPGPNYTCDSSSHHFRVYQNWSDAIDDWFSTTDINKGWTMWKTSKTIKNLLNYYAPPSDNNDTSKYIDLVTDFLIKANNASLNDLNNGNCSC